MSIVKSKQKVLLLAEKLRTLFIGREQVIRAMITATVAQEPVLFVGPPGTAKSLLVSAFCGAVGAVGTDYFEYMLTRFSEPGEILGPVDLQKLKEGSYQRRTSGQLPEARIAFLDEIFKANSAILNILLTLINEKKFYQDGRPFNVPLMMLFAASNEIPEFGEFDALKDRFVLKIETRPVQQEHFWKLIRTGLELDAKRGAYEVLQSLSAIGVTLDDFQALHDYLETTVLANALSENTQEAFSKPAMARLFKSLVALIQEEENIVVTDRKLIKLVKLIYADAMLFNKTESVTHENMSLLAFAANDFSQIRRLELSIQDRLQAGEALL